MTEPGAGGVAAREITITRIFDAPRELVWRAWTEPDRLACWWGKAGWTAQRSTIAMDVRPGGAFRVTTICDEDGRAMTTEGTYREVAEPERIVFAAQDGESVSTVTFTDLGDGSTEMVFRTTVRTSRATRDRAEGGLSSAFDRLAEHLA